MTITGQQIREARRLLRKTTFWITRQTGIDYHQLVSLQRSETMGSAESATLNTVRRALEAAGVEFIPENGGGAGVRLRKVEP